MNISIKNLANKKWFVPIVIILMIIVAISWQNPQLESKEIITDAERLKELCVAICGSSDIQVMITYEDVVEASFFGENKSAQKIYGVAIICNGGENPDIKLKIHEIVKSLYGISSTRIYVTEKY